MNKSEKLAKKQLEDEGYQVEYAIKTQWHRNDFWNLWDLIAVGKDKVRFVQVSSIYLTSGSHAGKDYKGFVCPPNCTKEFWRYRRKEGDFVIKEL